MSAAAAIRQVYRDCIADEVELDRRLRLGDLEVLTLALYEVGERAWSERAPQPELGLAA